MTDSENPSIDTSMNTQLAIIPVEQIELMANAVAKSGLFGVKTTEQALALMLVAQAEGRHPASAAKEYHIIQGKPSLKADAMLARFQQAGGSVKWNERSDVKVSATFSHPQGGELTITWSMEDAKRAKLTTDMWSKYPRQMLTARVISEGVRAVFPSVVSGIYTPEEVADFEPANEPAKIAKPLFKKAEPAPAIENKPEPAPIEVQAEAKPVQDSLPELVKLMDAADIMDEEILIFLRAKGAIKDSVEYLPDVPERILARTVEKWADVVNFIKSDSHK